MDEYLKQIEKKLVDRRKYRKSIRKQFDRYEALLRFRKSTEYLKLYKQSNKAIMEVLFRTLEHEKTYETRNLYFLFAIMETHFKYYSDMLTRMKNLNDETTLRLSHDSILQKNDELLDLLKNNEKEPITAEDIEKVMEKS